MAGSVSVCPECGATIPGGGTCRDNFHALLLLESEVPGGPGDVPHFYAVASYGLQHPGSMNYTAGVAGGLLTAVADVLDGRADVIDLQDFAGHADPRTTLTYIRSRDRLSKSPAYVLKY